MSDFKALSEEHGFPGGADFMSKQLELLRKQQEREMDKSSVIEVRVMRAHPTESRCFECGGYGNAELCIEKTTWEYEEGPTVEENVVCPLCLRAGLSDLFQTIKREVENRDRDAHRKEHS